MHRLNIKEGPKWAKQAPRNFRPELEAQIKQEIQRLLDVGFIKPVQHPAWLAKIMLLKKKNEQIMCCIDFATSIRQVQKTNFLC